MCSTVTDGCDTAPGCPQVEASPTQALGPARSVGAQVAARKLDLTRPPGGVVSAGPATVASAVGPTETITGGRD